MPGIIFNVVKATRVYPSAFNWSNASSGVGYVIPSWALMRSIIIWDVKAVTTLTFGCCALISLIVASIVFARVSLKVVPKDITTIASLFIAFFIIGFSYVRTPMEAASCNAGVASFTSEFNMYAASVD